jgi:uncharacterized RDD family membrane protein YckC
MNYTKVGLRAVAMIIDMIILLVIGYVIALFTGGTTEAGFELTGLPALLWFIVCFGYYVVLEATLGATIGKLPLGLRVVQVDSGSAISWQASLIRNVLRIVDFLPLFYLVGAILVWTSDKGQRLGDRVAKTAVIRK